MPSTIKLHRVFKAPPDRVFRAFIDPDALANGWRLMALRQKFMRWMRELAADTRCRSPILVRARAIRLVAPT